MKKKKIIKCLYFNYIYKEDVLLLNQFIQLGKADFNYKCIEDFIISRKNVLSKEFCPKCQSSDDLKLYPKCKIEYINENYPNFMFILFDLNYLELVGEKIKIISFTNEKLSFTNEDKYELKTIILAESINHFTCFLNKYEGIDNIYGFKNGLNYFHDGLKLNGDFIEINENLKEFLKSHLPYILIYKKQE